MHLLLIEDDLALHTTLQRSLVRVLIRVTLCNHGAQAIEIWRQQYPDVVVLDLTLPDKDGLEILAEARSIGLTTPVLILTARGTVGDKILGLNIGADDYLPKPFDLDELEARVRALYRRKTNIEPHQSGNSSVGLLRVDQESGVIYCNKEVLELTPRELAFLKALMARPGHAIPKERLFELVFPGERDLQFEAIEVVAYRVRKKILGTRVKLVTLRGLGYLLKEYF